MPNAPIKVSLLPPLYLRCCSREKKIPGSPRLHNFNVRISEAGEPGNEAMALRSPRVWAGVTRSFPAHESMASESDGRTSLQYFMTMCLSRLHFVVSALTPSIVI